MLPRVALPLARSRSTPLARIARNLSDLDVAEVFVVAEDYNLSLPGWQQCEGFLHGATLLAGDNARFRRGVLASFRVWVGERRRGGLAAIVAAQACDDAVEVGPKRCGRLVAMCCSQDSQERLLSDILRVVCVTQQAECGVPGRGLVSADKLLEGRQIAMSRVRHQFFVAAHAHPL